MVLMRKVIVLVFICLAVADMAAGQSGKIVPKSPAIRHDWMMGIVNIPEIGYGMEISTPSTATSYNFISLTNVTGYQFTRNVKVGVGYGLQMHNSKMAFPVFGDLRASLNGQGVVPFLAASGGVEAMPPDLNNDSRIFISGMLGLRIVTSQKLCTDISTGLYIKGGGVEAKATFFVVKLGIEIKGKRNDALK